MAGTRSGKSIDALIAELRSLSYNLWWSWSPAAQEVFHEISPFFWEHSNHNPVQVLNWVSGPELHARLRQKQFFHKVSLVCREFRKYMDEKNTWARRQASALKGPIAYFSAEFGLHESLHTYSGGLGVLAGDHTKSASDLGLPFIGVSLFYLQGYFHQVISSDGWQQERYISYDPKEMPLTQVMDGKGNPLIMSVQIGKAQVYFQSWLVHVGRARVFLIDTSLPRNEERHRNYTAHVYGGDQTNRIGQEILLGIGGVRLLRALGIKPSVFHMNEGHAAFLTLELLRELIDSGRSLDKAGEYVRKHCVFTTHTPVPAGHDRFDRGLIEANLDGYAGTLGMSIDQVMDLGRTKSGNREENLTMTVLALRFSRHANGVSELHGKVSREMWKSLYPGVATEEVPIGYITNGIHTTGWAHPVAMEFWDEHLGRSWTERLADARFWKLALEPGRITDQELWVLRTRLRRELIEFARKRLREQNLRHTGTDPGIFSSVLRPDALTIGFARRFATYKRAPLIFRDLEWAIKTFNNQSMPVQIIFAGKAHPRDDAGKQFIQHIVNLTRHHDLFGKVVFIENYDIDVARHLVSGADVWLNTPRRPMEASGTSGQKTAIHGGLHLSTMDGWWREAYDGNNGWKIGEDLNSDNETIQDDLDAASLRTVLENKVAPLFYNRGRDGIPHDWIRMVRHSVASLVPRYSTRRMVMDYTQKYYLTDGKVGR